MTQPVWMWYPGDYEVHHSLKLHCRREERGFDWPAFWRLDDCWHNVMFRKHATITKPVTVAAYGNGIGYLDVNGKYYPFGTEVALEPGEHQLRVTTAKPNGLPAAYVTGDGFSSGRGWEVTHLVKEASLLDGASWVTAGYSDMYPQKDDDPEIFKFQYETWHPVSARETDGGVLYDFGRQTFGKLCFGNISPGEKIPIFYGESEAEALDTEFSYICDSVPAGVSSYEMKPRAFRYIFAKGHNRSFDLTALYEYLPLKYRGAFRCNSDALNKIWDVAAYTFHLNSREFFLDGIKRDRWVWSGDAYQSFLINYYLFFDNDITKRTLYALRGKDPVEQHINTIMDYSFYWVMGIADYYRHTGDGEFVRAIYPRVKSLMDFCLQRLNANGLAVGLPGDWVFIDWADALDKTGAVCAEQMLLVRALESAAACAAIAGEAGDCYLAQATELRQKIDRLFWDAQHGAYIDSYESGRRSVTRHANIFALLLGFADESKSRSIIENVLKNEKVPQITTPYFKFYELEALCAIGDTHAALEIMHSYWGGMLALGATSFWEEYDPTQNFPEHYAMYGDKFGKSLCHAWGASPIYLLGKYFLGVRPTSDGYATFECTPDLGGLKWMEGAVPLPGGEVEVFADTKTLRVKSTAPGGTLVWKGERIPLPVGETVRKHFTCVLSNYVVK